MTLPDFKARLIAPGTPFSAVKGATSMSQAGDRPAVLPAAYVVVVREVAEPNSRMTGPVLQRVERDIAVVYVVEHLGDADGADAVDPLEEVRNWGKAQLVGWSPAGAADPVTFVGGEAIEAADGAVWFADTFSAPYYLTEAS